MTNTTDERSQDDARNIRLTSTGSAKSNIEFQTRDGLLNFRLSRRAIAFRLLPLLLAPIAFAFLFLVPGPAPFGRDPWFRNAILGYALAGQAAYVLYVLRDRRVPYIVDTPANALRRGKRVICALSDIAAAGVTIRNGRNRIYFAALTLRAEKANCRLYSFVLAGSAREAITTLADRLKIPVRQEETEGFRK